MLLVIRCEALVAGGWALAVQMGLLRKLFVMVAVQVVILCVPGELTTMAGRRLRAAVKDKVRIIELSDLTGAHTQLRRESLNSSVQQGIWPQIPSTINDTASGVAVHRHQKLTYLLGVCC